MKFINKNILTVILGASMILSAEGVVARDKQLKLDCKYTLDNAAGQPGNAIVKYFSNNELVIIFKGANPYTLYTTWIDHRNRSQLALAPDYPLNQGAIPRGVAPAFKSTQGVRAGMGLDANGVVTNGYGNAVMKVTLDYDILENGNSPVVGAELAMQGFNRIGGGWLRTYSLDPNVSASLQVTNPKTGLPVLPRSTPQGITIVKHPDTVTHGHTPGVGGVDHFPAYKGDFPSKCTQWN